MMTDVPLRDRSIRAVGSITFAGQFGICENITFDFRFRLECAANSVREQTGERNYSKMAGKQAGRQAKKTQQQKNTDRKNTP